MLNAGFLREAEELAKKALSIEEHHKNVPNLAARLREAPEDEEKRLTEVTEKVRARAAFYRQLGASLTLPTPNAVAPKWKAPEATLGCQLQGDNLRFFGSYEKATNLLGLAGLLSGTSATTTTVTHRIEFNGRLRGHMFAGTVTRQRDGQPTGLLDGTPSKVLMYLSEDESTLYVLENYASPSASVYEIVCVQN